MADRTQNINIIFKTNTTELENANSLLGKANAATDNLRQSSQKFGTDGAAAANQFSGTIAGLTLQMQQLKAQIDLTNQSDQARLTALRSQYSAMEAQLKTYQGQLQETAAQTQSVTASLGGLYSAVKTALTAGLIKEAISAALEMNKLAGQVDGVKRQFDKLPNSTLLMQQLKAATHDTVDELTLMQKALQAKNFGIPVEQLATLLEFATTRAQQTGLSVDYLVNSIVTGLGRNSVKILDNLQINIAELNQRVKDTGKTVQQVAIEMIGESLKSMDKYVNNSATTVDQLSAAWANWKAQLAKDVGGSGFISFITTGINNMTFAMKSQVEQLKIMAQQSGASQAGAFTASNPNTTQTAQEIDRLKQLVTIRKTDIEILKSEIDTEFNSFRLTRTKLDQMQEELKGRQQLVDATKEQITVLQQYLRQLGLNTEPEKEQVGLIEGWKKQIDALKDSIEKSTDTDRSVNQQRLADIAELERLIKVYSTLDDVTTGLSKEQQAHWKEVDDYLQSQQKLLAAELKANDAKNLQHIKNSMTDYAQNQQGPFNYEEWYKNSATFWEKLGIGFETLGQRVKKSGDMTVQDQQRLMQKAAKDLLNAVPNIIDTLLGGDADSQQKKLDAQLSAVQDHYDSLIKAAGDNQTLVAKLQAEEKTAEDKLNAEKVNDQKKQARRKIEIDTAANIIKSILENGGIPWGLPEGAIAAAMGAAQLLALNGFKDGVINLQGPGTSRSDSIPSMLSVGESVINAQATRDSMIALKAINSGKLNDKILNRLAANGGSQVMFNDAGIIRAIKEMPVQDIIKQGSMIFEAKKEADKRTAYIRSKYLNP